MLDKKSALPLYVQLEHLLKRDITTGKYKKGDKIPSETQLAKKYNITRNTVRRAISNLANEGLLNQVQGKGTFVCLKKVKYSIWNFDGFTDYVKNRNESPVSRILEKKKVYISNKPYLKLKRARGIERIDEKPLFLTIDMSLIPLMIFYNIDQYDFEVESLYNVMRNKYDIHPKRAELSLIPIKCDELTKSIFELDDDVPLLKAKGKIFTLNNIEIEKVEVIYSPIMEFKVMVDMN